MRRRRWLELLKDYDFCLNYHPGKANVVVNALSQKTLHMSTLMVIELELIEEFRDLSRGGDFKIDDNGDFKIDQGRGGNKICAPDMPGLKKSILEEEHRSGLSIHLGATNMYQDLRKMF
ncbi:hypothetical protein KIW84_031643 [Lathyrus oleraceus]|uniref:Uncharacterized protein n=1 Tax=Pisum sativum TaxID=3888 RepID=A0A9D4XST4_PEA|nr:hypothetical protein KIW84_031643 [Pisum sativum]